MRQKVIIGNWKMNKRIADARSFVSGLGLAVSQTSCQVGLAVPFTMIPAAAEAARGTPIAIGAQDVADQEEGAFTGEVSSWMVKDAGGSFALVGHSERRQLYHEEDAVVNRKVKCVLKAGLKPVVCLGETLEQHKKGSTQEVLQRQILQGLAGLSPSEVEHLIIAYEPVWAIGTGITAAPEAVQSAHAYCRKVIASQWGNDTADHIVLQYGGSVKPENAEALLSLPDVDGLLIGGASLVLESFNRIVHDPAAQLKEK